MRALQIARLSLLKTLYPDNMQFAQDINVVFKEVPVDEQQDEKVGCEEAEQRVLTIMREENFGPIGQSSRKVLLAKMLTSQGISALDRMDFLVV